MMAARKAKWGKSRTTGKPREEVWTVDFLFVHPDGKRERVRKKSPVNTRRGAEQYERELRAAMLNPKPMAAKEVPTFQKFADNRWMPVYPAAAGNRPSTIREKKCHLKLYLTPVLGPLRLDQIKGEVVDRLFATLRKRGLSPKTIKNVRATLRRILESAVEWEVLASLPRLPKVKVAQPEWDYFNQAEADKLVGLARDADERALLLFALHTGARAGEQLAVEWGDLDWQSGQVVIRRGYDTVEDQTGPTKSKRERRIPMTGSLQAALKAVRHLRGPLVFCRPDGSHLSYAQLHEPLWGACRRAGLRKVRWHDLRHSFASNLVSAGVPVRQVQEWMGHSTITMTMRYAHLAPDGGKDLIAVLEGGPRSTPLRAHGSSVAAGSSPPANYSQTHRKTSVPNGI